MDGIWAPDDIRTAERAVMATRPDGALMAQAATAVAVLGRELIGFGYGARVVLLVGGGDNGGDALFAGANLARRGALVTALLAVPDRVHAAGLAALLAAGGRIGTDAALRQADLVIDGLVGIGASGPLRDGAARLAEMLEHVPAPVLSVDLPSGVDPVTGAVPGSAVTADLTVCMGAYKPGLLIGEGRTRSGRVRLIDIGIGPQLPEPSLFALTDADLTHLVRRPGPEDTKYRRGVVGVVAGSAQYPGAAQLAVGSARLGGAGAVRYAGHADHEVVNRWPETIATETPQTAGRVQAWVVGPGLGDTDDAHSFLRFVLEQDVPVLVDADGLTLLGQNREWLQRRSAPTVLTPHDGEFERVFGEIGPDRLGAARRAADESGAVVLLKGDATVVAAPHGRAYVNRTGNAALATAGSGDVLSGLIGSLMATGIDPALAAAAGAYLHGLAGERAAEDGPVAAEDVIVSLRAVIADLQPPVPSV